MAAPGKYERGYSFSGWQANNPAKPLPGDRVDIELDNIANSVGQAIDSLAIIQRPDGQLQNGIVHYETLDEDLQATLETAHNEQAVLAEMQALLDQFKGTYYGAYNSDPATDPLGNPPTAGDLYFNLMSGLLRIYTGSQWTYATSGQIRAQDYTTDGSSTVFTLPVAAQDEQGVFVFVNGEYVPSTAYTVDAGSDQIIFDTGPDVGTMEIKVIAITPPGAPAAGTVTADSLSNDIAVLRAIGDKLGLSDGPSVELWGASPSASGSANRVAFQNAANSGDFHVPAGRSYTLDTTPVIVPSDRRITIDGTVLGELRTLEQTLAVQTSTIVGVNAVARPTTVPLFATDTLFGDFSSWAGYTGWLIIEVGAITDPVINQASYELVKCLAADGSHMQADRNFRFGYPSWKASKTQGVAEGTGTIVGGAQRATRTITVDDTTSLVTAAGGDLRGKKVIIRNKNGNDTYWGLANTLPSSPINVDKAYFEHGICTSYTATTVTLAAELCYTYVDYYVALAYDTHNVSVRGNGFCQLMRWHYSSNIRVDGVDFDLCSFYNFYGASLSRGDGNGGTVSPTRVIGATNGRFHWVDVVEANGGSYGNDNANLKFLGVCDAFYRGVVAYDMSSSLLGQYGAFGDFYFTGESRFSDRVALHDCSIGLPQGPVADSARFNGCRWLVLGNVQCAGGLYLTKCVAAVVKPDCRAAYLILDNMKWGGQIGGTYAYVRMQAGPDQIRIKGLECTGPSHPSLHALNIDGNPGTVTVEDYVCSDPNPSTRAVYVQGSTGLVRISNSRDVGPRDFSVETGAAAGRVLMYGNDWQGAVAYGAGPASNAVFEVWGDVRLPRSDWNAQRLDLNDNLMWVDSGARLRWTDTGSPPASTDDGKFLGRYLQGSVGWDPPTIGSNGRQATTVAVVGAQVGDPVTVGHTGMGANQLMLTGHVSAADTVTVVMYNPTASPIDPPSGSLSAFVWKH